MSVLRLLSFMRKNMKKFIVIAAIIILSCVACLYWSNNSLTVSRHVVSPENLPESFNGYRIVQISDLHNKDFGGRLSAKIAELEPDIIVITGDILDSYHTKSEIAENFVEEIIQIAPVYYVTGNHENRIDEYSEFRKALENLGVTVLDGRTVTIEKGSEEICLAGIDDLSFYGSSVLGENEILFEEKLQSLAAEKGDRTGILLSHRPELFDIYADCGFDLVFSGHAHGGQIRLPFIGGIFAPGQGFFPEYDAGIFQSGKTSMIISRGLGNSLFPFRIGNRPEIIVCELRVK